MQKLVYILIIVLFSSCDETIEKENSNTSTLTGTITNPTSDFIEIRRDGEVNDTIFINESGDFSISFEISDFEYVDLNYDATPIKLFLSAGDSSNLSFDAANLEETITFLGANNSENHYLYEKRKLQELTNEKHGSVHQYYGLNAADFIVKIDSFYEPLEKLHTSYIENNNLNESFRFIEKQTIAYNRATNLLIYSASYDHYERDSSEQLPEGFNDYLKSTNLNEERLVNNTAYQGFLKNRINTLTDTEYLADSTNFDNDGVYYQIQLKHIFNLIKNPKVKEKILVSTTTNQLRMSKDGINDSIFNILDTHITDPDKIADLKELYKDWERIAAGKKAPNFRGEDINGEIHALSDFLGSYVYVDAWATWCGPCKMELPYLEDLQEQFKEENITFISVSLDRNHDSWMKMVKDKNMKGVQLIAKEEIKQQLAKDYKIATIPRFILIDKDGLIIDSNAPRPSENIALTIESLIEKDED